MGLPKINEESNFIKINLPSGKKIGIKPWRVREEKELLFVTESMDEPIEIKKEIIKFLGKCIDNASTYANLSENDVIAVAMEMRKISKLDTIEYTYSCPNPKCKLRIEDEISLNDNVEIKPFDASPYVISENFIITFKEPSFNNVLNIIESVNDSLIKYNYEYLVNSIESVTFNGETYTEFTKEEVVEFLDSFDMTTFDKLVEDLKKRSSVCKLEKKLTCIKCKETFEVNFGDTLNFLVF